MIIEKEKAIEIVQEFLDVVVEGEEWFKNVKDDVLAILLYGSVAKGTNKEDSDIDLLFILPLKAEEEFTKGEYVYKYKGAEINIVMRSIERLRELAKSAHDHFQAEVFCSSEVIWQKNDEVSCLIKKIEKNGKN